MERERGNSHGQRMENTDKRKRVRQSEARFNQSVYRGILIQNSGVEQPARVQEELATVSIFSLKSLRLNTFLA